jgi:hypothetical protein
MPAPGSIALTLRVAVSASQVMEVGRRAGWAARVSQEYPAEENEVVEFSRYVGVERPSGELQTAHFVQLEAALQEDGIHDFKKISNGVVIGGHINPLSAAGLLVGVLTPEAGRALQTNERRVIDDAHFRGTCFAFRQSDTFLTAAHCVSDIDAATLFVHVPAAREFHAVAEIERHPSADVALLRLAGSAWPGEVEPFVRTKPFTALGMEFMAYGFPEDATAPDEEPLTPTQRLFRGYLQRQLIYRRAGYEYSAGEMSIPSPAGLSGGALFVAADFNSVIGIAAENVQSTTYVGRVEEQTSDGGKITHVEREHVQYGIAALLAPLGDWLDELVPEQPRWPS